MQVSAALAPTEAWTYTVNGRGYPGTAASPPIVVDEGDRVQIRFVNGGSKAMHVNMAHSIDFHSAEGASRLRRAATPSSPSTSRATTRS